MDDFRSNTELQDEIMKKTIISMYRGGYGIDFITKRYYRYKNKNKKPIKIDNFIVAPVKVYNLSYCRMYVCEVIYNYTIQQYNKSTIS